MVLGVESMKIFQIAVLLLIQSCTYAQETISDQVVVLNSEFKIKLKNNKCHLISKDINKVLSIKPPCYFLRSSGVIEQHSYADVKVDSVFMIIGTPVSKETRKEWGLKEGIECGSDAQGVLIKNNKVEISNKILQGGVMCKDNGTDEKNFWYFAH